MRNMNRTKKSGLSFIGLVVNFRSKFIGGIEEGFGGGFNFLNLVFLNLGDRDGEKLGGKIDDGGDAGLKFEV